MSLTWKEVWEKRSIDATRGSTLARLLAVDGFDTGFGTAGEDAWRAYVRRTADEIGITPDSSVFEVGCGAGAYLFDLYQRGCDVAGLDASSILIEYARETMRRGNWLCAPAAELDVTPRFDFVISSGCFLYFPDLDYAQEVLERMVRKARRAVMILDVPDPAKQGEAMAFRRRNVGEEVYAQRYAGLDHLYIEKAWMENTLTSAGVKQIRIADQSIDGYANSAWRYNVFGRLDE
ncbi:MAG TPA: class I SAM-dependent methyltransferase [Bryobacteraceae bacterium]|jgi:SAM-dependent methyltransferase|nr:class I SAM-dependent methyltransferase [Bryobacteraceae bacterium]